MLFVSSVLKGWVLGCQNEGYYKVIGIIWGYTRIYRV